MMAGFVLVSATQYDEPERLPSLSQKYFLTFFLLDVP
jgi:hypothetical protein